MSIFWPFQTLGPWCSQQATRVVVIGPCAEDGKLKQGPFIALCCPLEYRNWPCIRWGLSSKLGERVQAFWAPQLNFLTTLALCACACVCVRARMCMYQPPPKDKWVRICTSSIPHFLPPVPPQDPTVPTSSFRLCVSSSSFRRNCLYKSSPSSLGC